MNYLAFKETNIENTPTDFKSEEVYIKELDYFFTNAISRASKTMSECRQIKNRSKKLVLTIYNGIFTNFRSRSL